MFQVASYRLQVLVLFLLIVQGVFSVGFAQKLNVMTFNIRYDNSRDDFNKWDMRKESVVNLIDHYQPAIFGVQEGMYHQVYSIDSALTKYTYLGVGRDDGKLKGEFSAIFYDSTRVTVSKENTFWLSETPDTISVGWDASMERICTYGLFQDLVSQESIWVFNTHFDHRGPIARENSAQLILSKISEENNATLPVILMGDLNASPDSKPIALLAGSLDDALKIAEKPLIGPTGTFNGFNEAMPVDRRIDYIFTRGIQVNMYWHIDNKRNDEGFISDHLPVYIVANWPLTE